MRLEQLRLRAFRNVERAELRIQAPCVVLRGDNAQGKTNVLEALYLCATGRSFRHATAAHMLRHGAPAGQVAAVLSREGVRHEIDVQLRPQSKVLRVDGRPLRQTLQLLELVNMVAFFPDDLRIAKGSPEERRRFLDRAVAGREPPFAATAVAYQRALRSRNALLRGQDTPDRGMLAAFDAQLVPLGVALHGHRARVLAELVPEACRLFGDIMPGQGALDVELAPGMPVASEKGDDAEARLRDALTRGYPRDRARGMTSVGPHRADLLCRLGGRDVRTDASQGQMRALVLALKLAELVCSTRRFGSPPMLLLDDVSSELDARRLQALFERVAALGCQVFVSTTGAVPLPVAGPAQHYAVHQGGLSEAASRATPG